MQLSNISDTNAFSRFALGTSMTAFGIARVSRNPNCTRGRLMIALGAMKIAEGVFKYCPTKAMLSTNMQSAMNTSMQSMLSGQNSMSSDQINTLMQDFSAAISGNTSDTKLTSMATGNSTSQSQNSPDSKNSTNTAQNPS